MSLDKEADDLLETLVDNTEKLNGKEHDFILSMIENRDKGWHVSDGQIQWLRDIFDKTMN